MHHHKPITPGPARLDLTRGILSGAVALALAAMALPAAHAVSFATDVEDLSIRWDNTVKYSVAQRLKEPSAALITDANGDDGDRNFKKGRLISNRFDLLSEFDLTYKGAGLRLSAAGWYDQAYDRDTDRTLPQTANAASVPYNHFTEATRDLHGRKVELLDAFVFGRAELGDMTLSGRLGKHTLLYGESLFFGGNGVAGAMTAVDIVKGLSVPSTPFKELMMPIPQVSGQLQILDNLAFGAYYQFRWKRNRIPASGSYFSTLDLIDDGGERALAGPGAFLTRRGDLEAKDSGQGGMQLRWRPDSLDAEFGLYAARFHSKAPLIYASGPPEAAYKLVFPENIKVYGASVATTLADTSVAAEVSYRENTPFVRPAVGMPSVDSRDNAENPGYAVGNSLHAQINWIALLKKSALWDGGNFMGEIAWHRRQKVTKNEAALDPNTTKDASAIRILFAPKYYAVAPGLDLTVPIGVGYGISGRSPVINPGFSVHHGGDVSVGVHGEYLRTWRFGVNYTRFFGSENGATLPNNVPGPAKYFSYDQALKDRDFVSLFLQTTF